MISGGPETIKLSTTQQFTTVNRLQERRSVARRVVCAMQDPRYALAST